MFYKELDTIAKAKPHLRKTLEALDTYLASLSPKLATKIDAGYVAQRLKLKPAVVNQCFEEIVLKKLCEKEDYLVCSACDSPHKPFEKVERVYCDNCGNEINLHDRKLKYKLQKIVQTPRKSGSIYKPDTLLLINKHKRFLASESSKNNKEKKEALEDLASYLMSCLDGFELLAEDKLTGYGEMDCILINKQTAHFFLSVSNIGEMVFVECKNWKEPVDATHIVSFKEKLKEAGLTFGIYLSKEGFTSLDKQPLEYAKRAIKNAFKEGIRILPLTKEHLDSLAKGKDLSDLLYEVSQELRLY